MRRTRPGESSRRAGIIGAASEAPRDGKRIGPLKGGLRWKF